MIAGPCGLRNSQFSVRVKGPVAAGRRDHDGAVICRTGISVVVSWCRHPEVGADAAGTRNRDYPGVTSSSMPVTM